MQNVQARTGASLSCKECRRLKIRCDRTVPCGTCIKRGSQSVCLEAHGLTESGVKDTSTLVAGLERRVEALCARVEDLESVPDRANSLTTQGRHPPLAADFVTIAQERRAAPTQSWDVPSYTSGDAHFGWNSVHVPRSSSALLSGMDGQLKGEGASNQTPCTFDTEYAHIYQETPPQFRVNAAPNPSSSTYDYVYASAPEEFAQAASTGSAPRFNGLHGAVYTTEAAFPFARGQMYTVEPPKGTEIGREVPSASGSPQYQRPPNSVYRQEAVPVHPSAPTSAHRSSAPSELAAQGTYGAHMSIYPHFENEATSQNNAPAEIRATPASNEAASSHVVRGPRGVPVRVRARVAIGRDHHPYRDELLRSKCPKDRLYALGLAIQFRQEHPSTEPIPPDLLDELLQKGTDDKYYCFCCPTFRKARTITPARDHVRKSLGNFPFRCPNALCHHSSLRQADLNKHMRTCTNSVDPTSSSTPIVIWAMQTPETPTAPSFQ